MLRTRTDREAMQLIMQVLGPVSVSRCMGCEYEVNTAIAILRAQGIAYQLRKVIARPPHDPEREEECNGEDGSDHQ